MQSGPRCQKQRRPHRGDGQPVSGDVLRRRRWKGRGGARGDRAASAGSLEARGDGRTGLAGVKQGAAAGLAGSDNAPAAMGGGG